MTPYIVFVSLFFVTLASGFGLGCNFQKLRRVPRVAPQHAPDSDQFHCVAQPRNFSLN